MADELVAGRDPRLIYMIVMRFAPKDEYHGGDDDRPAGTS